MKFGFMQGRLSPVIDGKIQAFPAQYWRDEFPAAQAIGFPFIEWTLDQADLHQNPLMTDSGRAEIARLSQAHHLSVVAITGDCFMQAPFWKKSDLAETTALQHDFLAIAAAAAKVGAQVIVVPLVDGGRLENAEQEARLLVFMREAGPVLAGLGVRISFESDFEPARLARFISRLDPETFGINYDLGNSASLGFDPVEEWLAYGERVIHVHLKDRLRGGTTVPLGTGAVDFTRVFKAIHESGYSGKFVMQAARAVDGDHSGALVRYAEFCSTLMHREGLGG